MLDWFVLFLFLSTGAQQPMTPSTEPDARLQAFETRLRLEASSPLHYPKWVQVGPTEMGGRVTDLACFPEAPYTFFVAYASGGLWKTTNNGSSWTSLFDQTASISIGDIAVNPNNHDDIWVGTGEKNSSRSSYAGTGIYRSRDGGKSWAHLGLTATHHVSRILIDPRDPDTAYVAAIGHLYSSNPERGVFKTTDGGKSWRKVLFVNQDTGVIDLAMRPDQPSVLFAAAWERDRRAWEFRESGKGSGLYRTQDGGETWQQLTDGLPQGETVGRIGIGIAASQPDRIYITLDNQAERETPPFDPRSITKAKLKSMSLEAFLGLDDDDINGFLKRNNFHKDYDAESIRMRLKDGSIGLSDLLDYMFDGNAALFDRPVIGVQVYASEDGGDTWGLTHDKILEDFAYSYGYYFGEVRVDPSHPERIFITGVPLLRSDDGGQTFTCVNEPYVHVDHHALWIDPSNPDHLVLGNDGGVDLSYDSGASWHALGNVPVGQFYTVAFDRSEPYHIYGGLQDNGVWRGTSVRLTPAKPAWEFIASGDGAFIEVDPRDNQTVYYGFQFGHYTRQHMADHSQLKIYPRHKLKQRPYRFNWMTPIELSPHHNDILYMGAQCVLRSLDQGETWSEISPDLTSNPQQGDVPFGTLTVLRESPQTFATLFAGTDDGFVWRTNGGFEDWTNISEGLPEGLWVSSIEISPHGDDRVFVTLTGYRSDDFATYVFKSVDGGSSWTDIRGNLPSEPCNVIREDPTRKGLLFLGTDLGVWASFDDGSSWTPMAAGMPHVPVYAMEIQPDHGDLIAATHGRSIFVANLNQLRQFAAVDQAGEIQYLGTQGLDFDPNDLGSIYGTWWGKYEDPAAAEIFFKSDRPGKGTIRLSVDGIQVHHGDLDVHSGVNRYQWDFSLDQVKTKQTKKLKTKIGFNRQTYLEEGRVTAILRLGDSKTSFEFDLSPAGETGEGP